MDAAGLLLLHGLDPAAAHASPAAALYTPDFLTRALANLKRDLDTL